MTITAVDNITNFDACFCSKCNTEPHSYAVETPFRYTLLNWFQEKCAKGKLQFEIIGKAFVLGLG